MFTSDGIRYFLNVDTGDVRAIKDDFGATVPLDRDAERAARRALIHAGKALAYAWGRQDARDTKDCLDAETFSNAFGAHAYRFHTEQTCYLPSIQSAYTHYTRTGDVV